MINVNKKTIPISVIIPVYNVFDWLGQCMESVVNQTFSDFEVILINDGSTDGSDEKCWEWEKRDNRIRVITKANEGLSATRNCGIRNASGEYLVFIDPDDWVDVTYLEKLYNAIRHKEVEIAECDVYRFNDITGEKIYHVCSGNMGIPYSLEEHMKYGYGAIWNCMIKRSLFMDYGIEFPDCHSPAKAIYPLLIAISGRVANVGEALYYYRRFRQGSLTDKPRVNDGDEEAPGLKACDSLLEGFRRCNKYEQYEKVLQEVIKYRLSNMLAGLFYRKEKDDFLSLVKRYYSYVRETFSDTIDFQYFTLGGYNLNRILSHMNLLHNPYGRFNFSSIISLMHPIKDTIVYSHKNKYREIMVQRDIDSSFWNILEEVQPKYIFVDFIEERFDIIECLGGFITKSDAYDEAQVDIGKGRVIARNSEECFSLWTASVKEFVDRISSLGCKIIVIENYLSEEFGNVHDKIFFEDLELIQELNSELKRYYGFVRQKYGQILIVEALKCNYYYTDKQYEYGAIPSHLNEVVNEEIAKKIEQIIRDEK